MHIAYEILLLATQLEVLALLALWLLAGGPGGRRRPPAPPECSVPAEEQELERAWKETLEQLLEYSADTAKRARRGGGDGE